tara:strand:- start:186 stop:467 length:282 start_codon:yes stop_codon:yes gene_type:complete
MKIEIKSKSPAFKKFVEEIDKILSKTQHLTIDGGQMDSSNNHFEEQSRRLQKVGLEFENGHPPHIINSWVATDLIYDEIKAIEDEEDIKAANV